VQEDGVNSLKGFAVRATAAAVVSLFSVCAFGQAQSPANANSSPPGDPAAAVHDLQDEVRQLRSLVEEMRTENAESRAEMKQLRQDLQSTRALFEHPASGEPAPILNATAPIQEPAAEPAATPPAEGAALEQRVQKLEESTSLIGSKIDEQYQTKVETASKYRARLHGIILMNAFRNVGGADNFDVPDYSVPVATGAPQATIGATLRQSELGLEVFGPSVAGAKTSADVQLDFAGGLPSTGNGVNYGIVRLQTASLRLDWQNTSVVAGQDSFFASPLAPTSFASLAEPALSYAGNIWGWTPQLRVEHRFNLSDEQEISVQAGILDNLDWEFPTSSFNRSVQAGEASGQPAYALRTAWSRPVWDHPMTIGVAGYFGRQDWGSDRYVDAWAGMADWKIPLMRRLFFSGEFYRGRGIGGLGAATGRSIVYGGSPAYASSPIRGLDTIGGWSQLKFQLTPKLEINGVAGEDNSFAADVRGFASDANNFVPILGRNRVAMANMVFRPRSDLVFSAELRRLQSFPIYRNSSITNQVNLSMGILF
jgi:hypothetical protein